MNSDLHSRWYPIATSDDLPFRHVYHAKLLGREYAVWRADAGNVNVWENRCLHRGVRLSIGINEGTELKCQYHGWRYANRTAGCTYIPAHPADAPAQTICNNTYPVVEAYGMVWSGEQARGQVPALEGFESFTVLRPLPLNVAADRVLQALTHYQFAEGCSHQIDNDGAVLVTAADGVAVWFQVQPQDSDQSIIRGILNRELPLEARITAVKHHNRLLHALRDDLERSAAAEPPLEPMVAEITLQSASASNQQADYTAGLADSSQPDRSPELRVQVVEKTLTAEGIVSIRMEALSGQLPTWQPGAHIDVHLQNGLIRQYSLTNGPGQTDHYTIGVKLEPDSAGGSITLHQHVHQGDVLAISAPRNNFPLRRDSLRTVFIAGGIGVTPLLSMAQALQAMALDFEFHYFAQSEEQVAFGSVIEQFGDSAVTHLGLQPAETTESLKGILSNPGSAMHVYICGPGPMLDAARRLASEAGWNDDAIHFEYFKNTLQQDDSSSFEINLARSAITLQVPAGKSILQVLRESGLQMPSSCEQGACGTCRVGVIEGDVLHQDVYLNDVERKEGKSIMTCVSRAKSGRLILDI